VYSREILNGLAEAHPEAEFLFCYRPHRLLRSFAQRLPRNCRRRLLHEPLAPRSADLFHGLNQRLPRLRLPKTVTTFHDLFVIGGDYSSPEFRRRFQEQARDAAKRSDLVLAVSEFTARQVEELLGVERARLRVIPHGVHLPAGRESSGPRERIVLHVGAVQKRKNISRLVAAFAGLPPDWRLVLAGSFGYGAEEILRDIERSPRRQSIEVLGYVSDGGLARLYERASIFAFPSLDEGFGMPVLEAMARGVPVLTSNRSALPEVAGDAAVLVDPTDLDAITGGLIELAQNQDLRKQLAERGKTRAATFPWKTAVSKTWAAYRALLP
jgi:glycosyltransferase involved in cell wall biosynthesis